MIGCRPLTNEEITLVANSLSSSRDKALFILMLKTGFRIAEALSLRVTDVQADGSILDRITVARRNTKGKTQSRSVATHQEVKAILLTYLQEAELSPDSFLFQSREGENRAISRGQAYKIIKGAMNDHNLQGKVALHSTRKVFANKVYEALGKDLIKTSKALGHRSILSTVSYMSFRTEEIDEAVLSA